MISAIFWALLSPWTLLTGLISLLVYSKYCRAHSHFAKLGIPYDRPPIPFLGNFGRMLWRRESVFDLLLNAYNQFPGHRFFGMFDFGRPVLMLRDPELIRQIAVKDFDHFVDHRSFLADSSQEPLFGKSLFMLTGQKWRDMRATLSPAFTGSKMRLMFHLVVDCADQATAILRSEALASRGPYVPEMKDLFTRFTNDMIATTAFGISVNSLRDRDNQFYRMGKAVTNFGSLSIMLRMFVLSLLPGVARFFGLRLVTTEQAQFYHSLVHDTIAQREREGIVRPDMINLLMEARKGALRDEQVAASRDGADDAGYATVDDIRAEAVGGEQKLRWDDEDLTAQCFLFFLAGFETTATLLSFAAHELMVNPDVQQRLIRELDETKEGLGGKPLTYDALQRMMYLDQVVSETLRKWPPAVAMDRRCQKTYRMTDETGHVVQLEKGDDVFVPAFAIQRDPQYYADPDRFDPDRFGEERKAELVPGTYLPFGAGPRNCIGSRFALMECKAILFALLTTFTFEVAQNSSIPLQLEPMSFAIKAKHGFNIHLKPRF